MVTAKLICIFVFANAKCWFSHEEAHLWFTFSVSVLLIELPLSGKELLAILAHLLYLYFVMARFGFEGPLLSFSFSQPIET